MKEWMVVSVGAIDLEKMEMLISLGGGIPKAEESEFFNLNNPVHLKGFLRECCVAEAFKLLRSQRVIADFTRSRWGDELDRQSVDFQVTLPDGETMNLQAKSSIAGLKEHKKVVKRYGLDIPALVVRECDDVENIAARLTRMIKRRQKKDIPQGFESAP